ncbi:MAG: hypothetical protein KGS61_06125 [Verrucomicrobia bacterium]|nr:hypothetical protein [Verrucomicrobiota bacterium]
MSAAGGAAGKLALENDNFAERTAVTSLPAQITADTTGATKEPGEPDHGGNSGGHSLWWSWTPTADGQLTVTTAGSNFDTLLGVYTGTLVSALTTIGSQDQGQSNESITFHARAGVRYAIAVDGYDGQVGAAVLNLSFIASPVNDDFANRTPLTGTNIHLTEANAAATAEPGEPVHHNPGGSSVWWSWTAPVTGQLNVTTAGSDFDTLLGIYTGAVLTNLTTIANDDTGTANENLTIHALAGTPYAIAVDGYYGATGIVTLNLAFVPCPVNDDFTNRIALSGTSATLTGSNIAATREPGEPDHAGKSGGKSVWWSWTPVANGPTRISTLGSTFDTLLAVYTGPVLSNLTAVASDDSTLGDTASFRASASVTYHIAVDGYQGGEGVFPLRLRQSVSTPLATSAFTQDDEFWTVVTLADVGPYTNVLGGPFTPVYHDTGGNPGGYLSQSDPDGNTWYWEAPQKHLGDQSAAYGGTLTFDLEQSETDNQYDAADVVLIGAGLTLVYDTTPVFGVSPTPGTNWTSYRVPLTEAAGWTKDTLDGPTPTHDEFLSVLRSLSNLRIRGEYRVGGDVGGLDNVAFTATAAGPALTIQLLTPDAVTLAWPLAFADFQLEAQEELIASNGWAALNNLVTTNSNAFTVTDPRGSGSRFYRLHQP